MHFSTLDIIAHLPTSPRRQGAPRGRDGGLFVCGCPVLREGPGLSVCVDWMNKRQKRLAQVPPWTQKIKSLSVGGTESTQALCLSQGTIQKAHPADLVSSDLVWYAWGRLQETSTSFKPHRIMTGLQGGCEQNAGTIAPNSGMWWGLVAIREDTEGVLPFSPLTSPCQFLRELQVLLGAGHTSGHRVLELCPRVTVSGPRDSGRWRGSGAGTTSCSSFLAS